MARTINVIRLVGGPPKLDGSLCDLRLSARDRADEEGGQFLRAVHGSTVTAVAGLQSRCTDRRSADELAATWRALVYRANPGRARTGWRPVAYRFQGHYSLEARRNARGHWGLAVCAKLAGADMPESPPTPTVWSSREEAVDDAAGRFAAVAALIPAGLHAHRVMAAHDAVATCVADAARLCAVGAAITPSSTDAIGTDRREELVSRINALVHTIDRATAQLVDLHLELRDAIDPIAPVAPLAPSWAELA